MDQLVRSWQWLTEPPCHGPAPVLSTFRLAEIPPDVAARTLAFLTGFDLLALSHVNHQLHSGLLGGDAGAWQRLAPPCSSWRSLRMRAPPTPQHRFDWLFRFDTEGAPISAKQRYFIRRALHFHGARLGRALVRKRGGAIPTPSARDIATDGSFSFDLMFALLPTPDPSTTRTGGVLLGAQSVRASYAVRPDYYHQLVHVDPGGNLYCTVMKRKLIVAERLAFERWHHVALVFEVTGPSSAMQRVYLNGELIDTAEGWLHDDWASLSHAQLGTGCIEGDMLGLDTCGWYAYNGFLDDCRFWNEALGHDEALHLTRNGSIHATQTTAKSFWSMRNVASESAIGTVSLVRSTCPTERVVSHVHAVEALSSGTIPTEYPGIHICKP